MKPSRKLAFGLACVCLIAASPSMALEGTTEGSITVTGEYRFVPMVRTPHAMVRILGRFAAKMDLVTRGASQLEKKGLLTPLGESRKEVFCIAADEIEARVLEESWNPEDGAYRVRVAATLRPTDFVHPQVLDRLLESEEKRFTYQEEMEQPVSPDLSPGKELSKAYRYLRQEHRRIAIIYLDHLEKKYPNCSEVYVAKAMGFYGMDQIDRMIESLHTACRLGHREACGDLEGLGQTQERVAE